MSSPVSPFLASKGFAIASTTISIYLIRAPCSANPTPGIYAVNVAHFVRSLVRRPLALTAIAIATAIAGYIGASSASSVYQSTAVAVVIPPGSGSPDAGLNPLINLNNNTAQLTAVIATALQSDGGTQAALDAGGTGNFTVTTTFGDAAVYAQLTSQLVIVADAPDPDHARAAAAALVEYARSRLNKIQLDSAVPVVNNALLIPSVEPSQAVKLPTSAIRAAASYALGAFLGCVTLLLITDAIRQSARRWRKPLAVTSSAAGEPTAADAEDQAVPSDAPH